MAKQSTKVVTVTTLSVDSWGQYKHRWAVSGSAAEPYTVSEAKDGNWACSCIAWTRTHPREECKHILRVQRITLAPAPEAAPAPSLTKVTYVGRKMR